MRTRILVVDDEEKITTLVGRYLMASGYEVITAKNGIAALELTRNSMPDLAILDIGMPLMDGLETARQLRKSGNLMPILFLTARAEESDKIRGFELGADDYVVKPFSPKELVARVKAILRRWSVKNQGHQAKSVIELGDVHIDLETREVTVRNEEKELTATQFSILAALAGEPGRVFTRSVLLDKSMGTSFEGYERTLDAHIKNIRKALGDSGLDQKHIITVRGIGYKFRESGNEA